MKFNRTVVEYTHSEKQDGRISFYASRLDVTPPDHSRVFSLRFSKVDESLYLIPFGQKDKVIHGIGPNCEFKCSMGKGDRHISFHESGVVNVTLGVNQYRLRQPETEPAPGLPILSFAVKSSSTEVVSDNALGKKGKSVFIGGIGKGLVACVGVFVEKGPKAIDDRLNRAFVVARPPILQVVDFALSIQERNLTYWFSTWSAPAEFEGDWIVCAGTLPGDMMKYPSS